MKTEVDTTMNGFDTIIAVTQNSINGYFKFLHGRVNGIQRQIAIVNPRLGELHANLDPLAVRINVPKEPARALLNLSLQTGTLKYFADNVTTVLSEQPIAGWKVALKVKLDIANIEASSIPSEVKAAIMRRLPDNTIDPSMFSIRQLFMTLENIYSHDSFETSFPAGVADPASPAKIKIPAVNNTFFTLLNNYLQDLASGGYNILGYAVTVKNPKELQVKRPSFPPTNFMYATNLFLPDGASKPDQASYEPGLDTLNFLMMTDFRDWPAPTSQTWFGNWVTNKDQYGIVAVSRHIFVDRFLIPTISGAATLDSVISLFNGRVDDAQVKYDTSLSTELGKGTFAAKADQDGTYAYEKSTSSEIDIFGPGYTQTHKWAITHKAEAALTRGGNTIVVNGSTVIRVDGTHWHGYKDASAPTKWWRQSTTPWSLIIQLGSVTLGGLEVTVTPNGQEFLANLESNRTYQEGGDWFYDFAKALANLFGLTFDNVHDVLQKQMQSIYNNSVILANQIRDRLNGVGMFVFPGGQEFRMQDPSFNNSLDLLAKIRYETY